MKSKNLIFALAISLFLTSFSLSVKAVQTKQVAYYWHHITQSTKIGNIQYDTNEKYQDLIFVNGYKYTEQTKDITSIIDRIAMILTRMEHKRTYTTY